MRNVTTYAGGSSANLTFGLLGNAFVVGVMAIGLIFVLVLSYSLSQISTLQSTWVSFEHARSEKIRATTALHRSLGYGGMIHDFKKLILTQNPKLMLSVQAQWGAARSTIELYRTFELTEAEETALRDIEAVLADYRSTSNTVRRLVAKRAPVEEIVAVVKIDDEPAQVGLAVLDEHSAAQLESSGAASKPVMLNELRKTLGYGGFIDSYMDYVLRQGGDQKAEAQAHYDHALGLIAQYSQFNLTSTEARALQNIEATLRDYMSQLPKLTELAELGIAAHVMNRALTVDDSRAIAAFAVLGKEIVKEDNSRATQVAGIFDSVFDLVTTVIVISIIVICLLVIGIARLLTQQIVQPIADMTDNMTRLASGELDVETKALSRIQEIDNMSNALKVFKRNIKERVAAESALREREGLLAAIFNTVPDAILTVNREWQISTVNDNLSEIFGMPVENVIGRPVWCLLDDKSERTLFAEAPDVATYMSTHEGGTWQDAVGKREDGSVFPLEFSINPTSTDESGTYTVVLRDVTERHEIEKMKDTFISSVSHELRTPLTSIRGSLGLLTAIGQIEAEQDKELLDVAQRNSERLINLVNDILIIGKIDSSDFELNMTDMDLVKLATQSVEDMKGYAYEHNVKLELSCEEESLACHADFERLLQVMINLMSNAVKYSPKDGTVTLNIARRAGECLIEVIDRGRGIPEEFQDRIFGRFSQADMSDKREQSGTGLGLYISKSIAELHGGEIGFRSTLGEGTTFWFTVPLEQST